MKVYYISENKKKRNTAGAKAPADIASICKSLGYEEFALPRFPSKKNKIYQKAWLFLIGLNFWSKLKNSIEDGSVIIYQHPTYGIRITEKMIPIIKKKKHVKFIALIHDLESLRGGIKGVIQHSQKTDDIADNALLKKFDAIICHNEHMRQYLIEVGFEPEKLFNLDIFDYLTDENQPRTKKNTSPSIAIAGNLAVGKCAYVYDILSNGKNPNLKINLFGVNFQEDMANKNMKYFGSYKPDELPGKIEGDFGLVWDGTSAESCVGNTGEYLKYNNPHKTSLYLASGMPVVVWNQAAVADFILENHLGITVSNLEELECKINNITEQEYLEMCKNVSIIGKQVREGHYFKNAIQNAIQYLIDEA